MGDNEAGAVQHERPGAGGELAELGALDLAPVGEVLRARVRESYGAELVTLLRAGVSEDRAERLAAEHRSEVAAALTRRFAGEVLAGRLAVYLPDPAACWSVVLARRIRIGEGWHDLRRGARLKLFELGEIPSPDHPLPSAVRKPSFARLLADGYEFEEVFFWLTACRVGEWWTLCDLLRGEAASAARAPMPAAPALNAERVKSPKAPASGGRVEAARTTPPIDWFSKLYLRADWPGEEPAQRPAWPWGEYSTPDLELVAEAVRAFWIEWDGEAASAPKNDTVIAWLEGRGMSNNLAKVVATLIRSPKVPAGARPRRDE
jgi:hypothetical protein